MDRRFRLLIYIPLFAIGVSLSGELPDSARRIESPQIVQELRKVDWRINATANFLSTETHGDGKQDPSEDFVRAKSGSVREMNYTDLGAYRPFHPVPGKIEVLEIFSYTCIHCYDFEKDISDWNRRKPSYVNFSQVHATWDPSKRALARLDCVLGLLGRRDLHRDVFDTVFKERNALFASSANETREIQINFAVQHGISTEAFARAYDSDAVKREVDSADELTRRYMIVETPSIVINGRYVIAASRAGSLRGLINIADELVEKEAARGNLLKDRFR